MEVLKGPGKCFALLKACELSSLIDEVDYLPDFDPVLLSAVTIMSVRPLVKGWELVHLLVIRLP